MAGDSNRDRNGKKVFIALNRDTVSSFSKLVAPFLKELTNSVGVIALNFKRAGVVNFSARATRIFQFG